MAESMRRTWEQFQYFQECFLFSSWKKLLHGSNMGLGNLSVKYNWSLKHSELRFPGCVLTWQGRFVFGNSRPNSLLPFLNNYVTDSMTTLPKWYQSQFLNVNTAFRLVSKGSWILWLNNLCQLVRRVSQWTRCTKLWPETTNEAGRLHWVGGNPEAFKCW